MDRKGEINGFWQASKNLFLRILVALLFATSCSAVSRSPWRHWTIFSACRSRANATRLWVLMSVLFTTWFFLAGVPRNLDELEAAREYPKGLKILPTTSFLPIVFVYSPSSMRIFAKILISWIGRRAGLAN
jgi:hypothetical protein